MINLHLNLDQSQPVQFSSTSALKAAVVSNPFRYDGLTLFVEGEDAVTLVYVECYKDWEVLDATYPDPITTDSLEDAASVFVEQLNEWGIW